jgi:hypothetical protein
MKNSHPGKVAASNSLCIPEQGKETVFKVVTSPNTCKPPDRCTGMYELGRQAAQLHLKHYGYVLDLLTSLTENLCGPCCANLYAGYFTTKEDLEI